VLRVSFGLFAVSALLEGAITLAVVQALETLHPGSVRQPAPGRTGALAIAALALAVVGVLFASTAPDGLERLAENLGIASRAQALVPTPFADYEAGFLQSEWLKKASAGLVGLGLIFGACLLVARAVSHRRSA